MSTIECILGCPASWSERAIYNNKTASQTPCTQNVHQGLYLFRDTISVASGKSALEISTATAAHPIEGPLPADLCWRAMKAQPAKDAVREPNHRGGTASSEVRSAATSSCVKPSRLLMCTEAR